jgi:precorrin-3B synthase
MRSGDGLLVRVRPRAGAFSLAALRAIAAVAAKFGSGEIDLTNRGNLQLRGVTDETFDSVLAELDDAGLLDQSAEAEAVRNVVVDPLSGLDPAHANIRGLAAALEGVLARDRRLWTLPGKFGFSFSGVAEPRVGGRSADIMLSAERGSIQICVDGAADVRCDVSRDGAIEAVHRLALAFVELKANDDSFRRMRDAISRLGVATIFAMAGMSSRRAAASDHHQSSPVGLLGREESPFGVGIGLPFGRIIASQLVSLCDAAAAANSDSVHTGPQRVLVFPVEDAAGAGSYLGRAEDVGLITKGDDIRLVMDVCPGSAGCKNAGTDTRRDAQRFASGFGGSLSGCTLHISGCEKGCARRADASFTLVGRGGRYDLIRNGSADSSCVRETIDADDIGAAIARLTLEFVP